MTKILTKYKCMIVENNSEHYLELSYYVTYVLLDHVCNLGRVACWIRTS